MISPDGIPWVADRLRPPGSIRQGPRDAPLGGIQRNGELSVRFSYAESMVDPSFYLPLARAAEEAGYDGMVVPGQPLLSRGVRLDLPVLARPHPRVPRGQAVHRAVLAHPGHGRGHRAAPVHHLRPQAADAPSAAGGQAGHLGGGDDRQPAGPRRRVPARGPRTTSWSTCPGRAGAGGWTRRSTSCRACRPVATSSTTARSTTCRRSRSARRPTEPLPILVGGHATAALRRAARSRRLAPRRRRSGRPARTARAARPAARGGGDRRPALRGPRDLARRLLGRRHPPARGAGRHRRDRRASAGPTRSGPDTEALQTKLDNLRRFADDVIAKVPVVTTRPGAGPGLDGRGGGRGPGRPGWPCSPTTRWSRIPIGPSAFDPEGKGHRGADGHRRLLRQRHRRQRVDPLRHPPVVPVRRRGRPTSG